jgi:hypothetical protein
MGFNDLFQQLLGTVARNPEIQGELGPPLTSAGKSARANSQPSPELQPGRGGGSSIAGILEGVLSGMRGDPYGPANQRMNQMKMGIALVTAKREAEEAKLKHRLLQLMSEKEEDEATLRKQPITELEQVTKTVPLPPYNPLSPRPYSPEGATTEQPTGEYKLNLKPGIPAQRLEYLKKIFGEEAVNRQLGMGKPEEWKASSGIFYKPSEGPKSARDMVAERETSDKSLPEFREWKKIPGNENKTITDYWDAKKSPKQEKMVYKNQNEAFSAGESARKLTATPDAFSTIVTPSQEGYSYSIQHNPAYKKPEDAEKEGKEADKERRLQGKDAVTLRKEFNNLKEVKDYKDVRAKINVMEKALEKSKTTKNFVAIDQALITLFNKMTDPQSVVRESEYARTPENIGIYNRLLGKIEKLRSGGAGLTAEERSALMDMAKEFYGAYHKLYSDAEKQYSEYAKGMGLSPELVVPKSEKPRFTIIKVE